MPGVRGLQFHPKHDGCQERKREATGPSTGTEIVHLPFLRGVLATP